MAVSEALGARHDTYVQVIGELVDLDTPRQITGERPDAYPRASFGAEMGVHERHDPGAAHLGL